MKKATLPYEYLDSIEKFYEESLPPKEKFYSSLTDSDITDDMYSRLMRIWDQFGCICFRMLEWLHKFLY